MRKVTASKKAKAVTQPKKGIQDENHGVSKEVAAVVARPDFLDMVKKWHSRNDKHDHKLLEWLSQMPEGFTDARKTATASVSIELDMMAWLIYARAAKHRGITIEECLSVVLCSEDCAFEDHGYLTSPEWADKRSEERKLAEAKGGAK